MLSCIPYNEIKDLKPEELIRLLDSTDHHPFSQLCVGDLLLSEALETPIFEVAQYRDVYRKGVYCLYNTTDQIRYVGQTKDGFYGRFIRHLTPVQIPNRGDNAILRYMGGEHFQIAHNDLTNQQHEVVREVCKDYKLLVIDTSQTNLTNRQINWLEKIVQKGYVAYGDSSQLFNGNIGRLENWMLSLSIEDVLNSRT